MTINLDCRNRKQSTEEVTFDVSNDLLPISVSPGTSHLIVNCTNFNSDIDFTGQISGAACKGSRVVLRKVDSSPFKIIYSDGVIDYSFINKKGEYIELYWSGSKFTI